MTQTTTFSPPAAKSKGHPKGLYVLFLTEMWERFSYYGMRALLVLFLVAPAAKGGFGFSRESASQLYGWYTGLVYLTPIAGGWLADRFLGLNRSMLLGGLVIAAGHFSLACETTVSFYLGLLLIIIGTGLFKPCVSTMVGQLYDKDDPRRDGGFTLFYMGINLGALIGTLACGYLGESPDWGWRYGFGAAGVGMCLGLSVYLFLRPRYLSGIGEPPTAASAAAQQQAHEPLTQKQRHAVWAIGILALFVVFFWMAFEQAGSSMNLFALEKTRRAVDWPLIKEIPASWFQSVNPAMILIAGPVFAWLWLKLGSIGREPSSVTKMASGLVLLAAGFVVMVVGALSASGSELASPMWLVGAYVLHTLGEICLSPVGLSLVSKLAPPRYASLLMGTWFLSNFIANLLAGYLAGAVDKIGHGDYGHVLGGQADFYLVFVATSLVAAVALFAMRPMLKRLMAV